MPTWGTITIWYQDVKLPPITIQSAQYKGNTNGMIEVIKSDGTSYWFNLTLIGSLKFVPGK